MMPRNDLLTKRLQELRFLNDGIRLAVILAHIHGIDVVRGCCRDLNDRTAHCTDKRRVFPLRVNDDDIRI